MGASRARGPTRLALTVRAAGGVVTRRRDNGSIEVLLVHRPQYDDWTLPKGKCGRQEPDHVCALREVEEETGMRCELLEPLPSTRYRDGRGRSKTVRYWLMQPVGGEFEPHREVDEIRWLAPDDAACTLTYERDLPVLRAALERSSFCP
jgi:8-oxo-dGTP pyrophosphatase MutT (NUDIX family)